MNKFLWALIFAVGLAGASGLGWYAADPATPQPPVHEHQVLTFNCKPCANILIGFIASVNSKTNTEGESK